MPRARSSSAPANGTRRRKPGRRDQDLERQGRQGRQIAQRPYCRHRLLALSKDGKFLAPPARKDVIIWDLAAARTSDVKGHTEGILRSAFQPRWQASRDHEPGQDRPRLGTFAGAKELASFKVERVVEVKDAKGKVSKITELGASSRTPSSPRRQKIVAGNSTALSKIYDVECQEGSERV